MTLRDIDTIVDCFAASARVAQRRLRRRGDPRSPRLPDRRVPLVGDQPPSRRVRRVAALPGQFAAEIVGGREATSPTYPVIFRFSQFKERDYSARLAGTPDELAEVLAPIAAAGLGAHASTRRAWEAEFAGSPLNLAGWAKRLTGLPTIAVGSVGLDTQAVTASSDRPESLAALADRRDRGEFDLLAVGRPLLANPGWVSLVASGDSRRIIDYRKEHESVFR